MTTQMLLTRTHFEAALTPVTLVVLLLYGIMTFPTKQRILSWFEERFRQPCGYDMKRHAVMGSVYV